MAAMRAFYRDIGWREASDSSDEHAMFHTAGAVLALFPYEHLAADANSEAPPFTSGFRGISLAINLESREAVDAAFETLREAGATILKEPEDVFWGGYSGYFTDPEGHYWEVAWAPMFQFDERGGLIIE